MKDKLDKRISELVGLDCDGCSESCFDNDGNITGCPIQLQHILLAIENADMPNLSFRSENNFLYFNENQDGEVIYNLSKSYNDQEEEVHKFLAERIKIEKI